MHNIYNYAACRVREVRPMREDSVSRTIPLPAPRALTLSELTSVALQRSVPEWVSKYHISPRNTQRVVYKNKEYLNLFQKHVTQYSIALALNKSTKFYKLSPTYRFL